MVVIGVKGTVDIGGVALVIRRNLESGRIELPTRGHSKFIRKSPFRYLDIRISLALYERKRLEIYK